MSMQKNLSRRELEKQIYEISFYLDDLSLYLDLHPCDEEALEMRAKYQQIETQLENEYEYRFGPIRMTGADECTHFSWIDDPWPWQLNESEA